MGIKMRSPYFKSVDLVTPTAGYTAGQMLKVEDLVGVIVETKTKGQTAVMVYSCEKIVVPKRAGTGLTITKGDKVYFRAGGPDVTDAPTGNILCGRALEDAAATATEILIDLNGAVEA